MRAIGKGGMGVVLEAEHLGLGRRVAIKVLLPDSSRDRAHEQRFQREAELVSRIGHKNLVEVYDFGRTSDGQLYFVMELLAGETLRTRFHRGPLSDAELAPVFAPLLSAVHAAHQIGAVHRDLKPDNIMLVPDDSGGPPQVKLLDFGVAKIRDEPGASTTVHGAIIGTPAYMAPEQIKRSSSVDGRADMYAVGLICYEALCGQRPFVGNQLELLTAQLLHMPEPPSVIAARRGIQRGAADWPKLDAVILKALAKEPTQRFADCAELLVELNKAWLPMSDPGISMSMSLPGVSSSVFITPSPSVPTPSPSLPATQLERRPESAAARQRTLRWVAAGAVMLALGGGLAWSRLGTRPGTGKLTGRDNPGINPPGSNDTEADVTPLARAQARIATAEHGRTEERRALLEAIGAVHSRGMLPSVITLIGDEHPAVWRPAVQAAQAIGRPGDGAMAMALTQVASRAAAAAGVEVAMARLLVGDTAVRASLDAVVAGKAMEPELRLRAAVVLAQAGLASAANLRTMLRTTAATGALRQGPYRGALAQLVRMHDGETVKRLSAALKSDNVNLRSEAAEVLARADQADGKDALLALAQAGSGELAPALALAEAGDGRVAAMLVPRLHDVSAAVRQRVVAALGQLAEHGAACSAAQTALTGLLTDADPQVATTAAVAWLSAAACAAGPTATKDAKATTTASPAMSEHDRPR